MKISTKGRYALRIMLDIATESKGGYVSVKAISDRQNITVKYMEQIISPLLKAGYLKSYRGNSGGYKLAMEPERYRVGDIITLMEGSVSPSACVSEGEACPMMRQCLTRDFWVGLDKVVNDYMNSKTLKDLMPRKRDLDAFLL